MADLRYAWLFLFCVAPACAQQPAKDAKDKDKPEPEYAPFKNYIPTDKVLEKHLERVKKWPRVGEEHGLLGFIYLRKARETGDYAFYDRAEASFRRAVELLPRDPTSLYGQALVLNARHQFAASLRQAQELARKLPEDNSVQILLADIQLEIGEVEKAEKTLKGVEKRDLALPLYSRWARLAELRGQTDEALKEMQEAVDVEAPEALTPEGRSWFTFRQGEINFNAGRYDKAAEYLEKARGLNPRYPLILAYLGKVRLAQGKLDEAIKLHAQAIGVSAELYLLADLGDLYLRAGKEFLADLNFKKLVAAGKKQDVYARELSLFYSNHDRDLPEALELARKEMTIRKDIYAYDTLAWALYKNKQYKEAGEAMTEALKLGTRDASLYYHAGMIQAGLGDKVKARDYLERALKLNPHFSALQAEKAKKALEALKQQ